MSQNSSKPDSSPIRREKERLSSVVSARLPDGRVVEMLYRPQVPETAFCIGREGASQETKRLSLPDGFVLIPYSPRNNLLTHRVLLFPTGPLRFGSETALLAEVRGFINRYVDVSPAFEGLAALYVLFSWRFDDWSDLPYLRVRGDYGSGKSRFLLTVGSLCYKPIFASGASTVSPLFRILDSIGGTLIVDEGDFRMSDEKAEIVKILNNGNSRGFPVLRSETTPRGEFNPRAFSVFGPKVVATRRHFEDRALESRCITEDMGGKSLRPDIPLNLPTRFQDEATVLRNKLLCYRFQTVGTETLSEQDGIAGLEPRLSQIIAPLLEIAPDRQSREELLSHLGAYGGAFQSEQLLETEALVLSIVRELSGQPSAHPVSLQAIADRFSELYGRDFGGEVSPRWIGQILRKRLFLVPMKSRGRFVLPISTLPRLEELYRRYGIGSNDSSLTSETGDEGDMGDDRDNDHAHLTS